MAVADVTNRRLASQFLTARGPKTAADVVRALGAVQAQDYAGAKWALGQRTRGATDAEVEREIDDGHILRTHVLRPTWHFVAPEDIRWMLALTAPRVNQAMAYHGRILELTPSVCKRSNDAIAKALAGGKHLTRAELSACLERAGVKPAAGQRLGHLMMNAELDGVVCSGARRGKQFTYALLDERVPPSSERDRDEALLELTRRYFTTRGPATIRDFSWWSGLTIADAKRGVQIGERELETVSFNGHEMWLVPRSRPQSRHSAHLLPNYDEYFIGYKDRSAVGERVGHTDPVTGGDARITHVAFVDGQLVGQWKRLADKEHAIVDMRLWARLTADETSALQSAVESFSRFIGQPVVTRGLEGATKPLRSRSSTADERRARTPSAPTRR
jgi:hypothetical protein